MIVEICTGNYQDALNAFKGGAMRIELNSALHLGGLTPTIASLLLTKQNTNLKVITMIRPRAGAFVYTHEEFEEMVLSSQLMLENGADGLAIGLLTQNDEIDFERLKIIKNLCEQYHKELVFHRAIDCVKNMEQEIEKLIDLKVDRILTSGHEENAILGQDKIKDLYKKYGNQIEILAGSGINEENVKKFIQYTHVKQVHSSCKGWKRDQSSLFSYDINHQNAYEIVDTKKVQNILKNANI